MKLFRKNAGTLLIIAAMGATILRLFRKDWLVILIADGVSQNLIQPMIDSRSSHTELRWCTNSELLIVSVWFHSSMRISDLGGDLLQRMHANVGSGIPRLQYAVPGYCSVNSATGDCTLSPWWHCRPEKDESLLFSSSLVHPLLEWYILNEDTIYRNYDHSHPLYL